MPTTTFFRPSIIFAVILALAMGAVMLALAGPASAIVIDTEGPVPVDSVLSADRNVVTIYFDEEIQASADRTGYVGRFNVTVIGTSENVELARLDVSGNTLEVEFWPPVPSNGSVRVAYTGAAADSDDTGVIEDLQEQRGVV